MAEYVLKLHQPDTTVLAEIPLEVWAGNRRKSNERALAAVAESGQSRGSPALPTAW